MAKRKSYEEKKAELEAQHAIDLARAKARDLAEDVLADTRKRNYDGAATALAAYAMALAEVVALEAPKAKP